MVSGGNAPRGKIAVEFADLGDQSLKKAHLSCLKSRIKCTVVDCT
jgi:hypothetical protein